MRGIASRVMDVVVSAVGLVALAPLFALIAIAIKLESRGPVIFKQTRIGYKGKPFTFYKFRTMRHDPSPDRAVANMDDEALKVDDFHTYMFYPPEDRVTRVGRFLRRTSLDELPNLFNVLKGDMSLVGPRPEVPRLVEQYPPEYHRRHDVRPGITGLAQVNGRGDLTYHETIVYDLDYVNNHSFLRDLAILARTVPTVLRRRGAR
ncbi:MAG TPA: sugar transferase [Dehalococcoidia bacterium]|nr:sugar transferase [Dehalococcoidia bacterium]